MTYPSFPPTRLSPDSREQASGSLAIQFMDWVSPWPPCALFILRVMTHRRVQNTDADLPESSPTSHSRDLLFLCKKLVGDCTNDSIVSRICSSRHSPRRCSTLRSQLDSGEAPYLARILPDSHPTGRARGCCCKSSMNSATAQATD